MKDFLIKIGAFYNHDFIVTFFTKIIAEPFF